MTRTQLHGLSLGITLAVCIHIYKHKYKPGCQGAKSNYLRPRNMLECIKQLWYSFGGRRLIGFAVTWPRGLRIY